MLVDTHCHIHEADYALAVSDVLARAHEAGVGKMICVGTSEQSSAEAVAFAAGYEHVFAAIGVHPHETKEGYGRIRGIAAECLARPRGVRREAISSVSKEVSMRPDSPTADSRSSAELATLRQSSMIREPAADLSGHLNNPSSSEETASRGPLSSHASLSSPEDSAFPAAASQERKLHQIAASGSEGDEMAERGDNNANIPSNLIAIGEIGLDYYYTHSPREVQIAALEAQIQIALNYHLPVIFHVREAFDDFWPIFDNFHGIRGELHSFTDTQANVDAALARGLYIGVNGISTFTKDPVQQRMFAQIPLERMLLETDAPFLTPAPNRGKVNEPAFVRFVAQHHAAIRGITPEEVAAATSNNASTLFAI